MKSKSTQILTHEQVEKMIQRLAYQVYENHFDVKELTVAAINGNGIDIATMLCEHLQRISKIKIQQLTVTLDKAKPDVDAVKLSKVDVNLKDKYVLVVDDVLKSGKTLMHALLPFIKAGSLRIQTLVLVDRNHKSFPVSADYIGLSLATTLQEHVEVSIDRKKVSAFLY